MYGYGEKINNRLEYIPREAGLRIPDPDPVGSGMFFSDSDPVLSFRIRIRPV